MISAVGQLNRPQLPKIEGRDSFAGPAFHSARWDHSVDLTGKRVGVIGTGCSAAQFAPIVAEQVEHLEIFQRTPNWHVPGAALPPRGAAGLPVPARATCRTTASGTASGCSGSRAELLRPMAEVDPDWPDKSRSVGEGNDLLRQLLTEALEAQYPERPDLLEKALPQYPPAAKRIIVDDGTWAATLHRDNVTLTTTGIDKIVPEGVVTVDGELHEFDVLLYGTGFQPSKFLTPMKVVGKRRRRPPRSLGRRRPGLPRRDRARLPELLHALRAEHEHRRQRQRSSGSRSARCAT